MNSKRKECLELADSRANDTGEKRYGKPENNFLRIANLWNAHLENRYSFTPHLDELDVSMMMGLMKIARIEGNPSHADSYIDNCSYGACSYEIADSKGWFGKEIL